MIAQQDSGLVRKDMRRRYDSVGVSSGLSFYDWVKKMFPRNLGALSEQDLTGGDVRASGYETAEAKHDRDKSRPTGVARSLAVSHVELKAQPAQPFDRKTYMKDYMEKYRKRPVVCPKCGHEFIELKRKKA